MYGQESIKLEKWLINGILIGTIFGLYLVDKQWREKTLIENKNKKQYEIVKKYCLDNGYINVITSTIGKEKFFYCKRTVNGEDEVVRYESN